MSHFVVLVRKEGESKVETAHGPGSEAQCISFAEKRREQDPGLSYRIYESTQFEKDVHRGYAVSTRERNGS